MCVQRVALLLVFSRENVFVLFLAKFLAIMESHHLAVWHIVKGGKDLQNCGGRSSLRTHAMQVDTVSFQSVSNINS